MIKKSSQATAVGMVALTLWSSLALLTTSTGDIPPLQLTAMAFTLAWVVGQITLWQRRGLKSPRRKIQGRDWLIGVGGFFGYHFFYFMALRQAPVVQANLINYLWPLLMLLFSSLLPGEKMRWYHLAGGLIGFAGAALVVSGGTGPGFDSQYLIGYISALLCATIWAGYSVLTRRFAALPTSSVTAYCGVTAALSWLAHLMLENTIWPVGWQWLALVLMGLGPMGLAFFAWDQGIKKGNLKTLGAMSYFVPLLSTLLLVGAGQAPLTRIMAFSCLLIIAGALLASGILLPKSHTRVD